MADGEEDEARPQDDPALKSSARARVPVRQDVEAATVIVGIWIGMAILAIGIVLKHFKA